MGAISPADVACTITQGHNVNKGTSPSKNSMCSSILGSNEAKMGYDGDITWYNQHVMQIWWDIGRTWIYDSNSPTWGWAVWRIQFRLLQWLYTIIPMISQWYHQFGIIDDFLLLLSGSPVGHNPANNPTQFPNVPTKPPGTTKPWQRCCDLLLPVGSAGETSTSIRVQLFWGMRSNPII